MQIFLCVRVSTLVLNVYFCENSTSKPVRRGKKEHLGHQTSQRYKKTQQTSHERDNARLHAHRHDKNAQPTHASRNVAKSRRNKKQNVVQRAKREPRQSPNISVSVVPVPKVRDNTLVSETARKTFKREVSAQRKLF